MNIKDCVYNAIVKLSDDVKAEIIEKIDSFATDGEIIKYMKELQAESKIQLVNTKLHLMIVDDLSNDMKSYMTTRVKGPKEKDPRRFILDFLSGGAARQDLGKTGRVSLERHIDSVIGDAHSRMAEMIETFKPSVLSDSMTKNGIKNAALGTSSNKALQNDMIRAIFGDSNVTGAASKFAKAWREVTENLRVRYNNAGGNIKKLDDFNMPTYHDSDKLHKLGKERWVQTIKKHGDIDRIKKNSEAKRLDLERPAMAKAEKKVSKASKAMEKAEANVSKIKKTAEEALAKARETKKALVKSEVALFEVKKLKDKAKSKKAKAKVEKAEAAFKKAEKAMEDTHAKAADTDGLEKIIEKAKVRFEKESSKAKSAVEKARVPKKDINEILSEMFDTISTEGMSKFEPKGFRGVGSFSSRHNSQRQIFFKSGDDYLDYHTEFGTDDYFNASMGYIDRMSTEIGAMEKLGPNPDLALAELIKVAEKESGEAIQANVMNTYDEIMNRLIGDTNMIGKTFGTVRNIETGGKLGMAVVSSISDVTATIMTSAFNDVPILKSLSGFLSRLRPAVHKSDRVALTRMGLMGEYALANSANLFRYGEITGWGKGFAQSMLRLSGLNHWTTVAKTSFSMEFLSNLASKTDTGFSQLAPGVRNSLERYGIGAADWENIRKTEFFIKDGTDFVNPQAFTAKGDQELAAKIVGMVREETTFAVPEANAKTRAMMNQGTSRNTILGESVRTVFQFKNYGVSVLASHLSRGLYQEGVTAPLVYIGSFMAGSTMMGYVAMSAKDVLKGKTPRDMSKSATWREAFLQGGSAGIVADLVANAGFGGGLAQALVGPFLSDVGNFGVFMYGKRDDVNVLEAKMYKQMAAQLGAKAAKMTIGQLWFMRQAVEKSMIDHLERLADDNYNKKQRSRRRRLAKEYGQSFIGE